MIRVLVILVVIAALAVGAQWLLAHPGQLAFTWLGYHVQMSIFVAIAALAAAAVVLSLAWGLIRFLFRLPKAMSLAARVRKRERGYEALSRGLIAIGAGDARAARKEASEAGRLIRHEPMTLLLRAQAAQLSGDRATARALFEEMARRPETKLLGLRGLYVESRRAGEDEVAYKFAEQAQQISPVAWAGHALIEKSAAENDWEGALAALERSGAAGQIDKGDLAKGRAALKLAMARERAEANPDTARALAQEAFAEDPGLAPAAALAGRLHGRRGDYKKAAKVIEQAWERAPHPDLAEAYVDVRAGDSSLDRLKRARKLAALRPQEPEGRLAVAATAIAAREFGEARAALTPLVEGDARPTARVCAAMAHLEEAEGHDAKAREWWGRAARAPRDKVWIADGVVSERWEPVSPKSGELGAFVWATPDEGLAPPLDLPASIFEPLPPPEPPRALEVAGATPHAAPVAPRVAAPSPPREGAAQVTTAADRTAADKAVPDKGVANVGVATMGVAEKGAATMGAAPAKAADASLDTPAVTSGAEVPPVARSGAKGEGAAPAARPVAAAPAPDQPVETASGRPPGPSPAAPAPGLVDPVRAAEPRHPLRPEPVVFPLPKAPDDPGVRV